MWYNLVWHAYVRSGWFEPSQTNSNVPIHTVYIPIKITTSTGKLLPQMSQTSGASSARLSHCEQIQELKLRQADLVNTFIYETESLEETLCKVVKKLVSNLRTRFMTPIISESEAQTSVVEVQIEKNRKLKAMITNMNKLLSDFRKTSSKMFEESDEENDGEGKNMLNYVEDEEEVEEDAEEAEMGEESPEGDIDDEENVRSECEIEASEENETVEEGANGKGADQEGEKDCYHAAE